MLLAPAEDRDAPAAMLILPPVIDPASSTTKPAVSVKLVPMVSEAVSISSAPEAFRTRLLAASAVLTVMV